MINLVRRVIIIVIVIIVVVMIKRTVIVMMIILMIKMMMMIVTTAITTEPVQGSFADLSHNWKKRTCSLVNNWLCCRWRTRKISLCGGVCVWTWQTYAA